MKSNRGLATGGEGVASRVEMTSISRMVGRLVRAEGGGGS